MSERQGIEIDRCPNCRGIWLDRGELDKIIQRAADEERPDAAQDSTTPPHGDPVIHGGHGSRHGYQGDSPKGKLRRPFWMDIFE